MKQKRRNLEKAFRPGNPSKKQASSGDYYGTFCVNHTLAWEMENGKIRLNQYGTGGEGR